ncbi:PfkB family carbohydrate kinase [Lentzea albidocapillata]|uniref:Sugar or nucleoside kinase, ribokinase family n=1 Tax=Lentzea albidocapillata TaxID=40571 RepID=A0A1W2EE79_9PSEU|nr:PfkB family carbohydrate kinase [Lentzea albidocapillata]SMD07975.1 Sugar or nucleoside kinase, ribokinase family [Lentzea albidocapillata]
MAAVLCVGLTTLDVTQRVDEFPDPGQKIRSLGAVLSPGGPAANAARAVAALGGRAALLTSLGADALGEFVRASLDPVQVIAVPGTTPVSMVVVRDADGERTVVSRNASVPVTAPDLTDLLAAADVVLLDGHHEGLAIPVARRAKAAGLPVVLDAGSWKPVLDHLLPLVDVAACSAGFERSEAEVHSYGVPLVIRTHGAKPVTWSRNGSAGELPVPAVAVNDTNGAGDVWHGAYAYALASGADPVGAIGFASEAAAVRVGAVGDWVEELARWQDSRSGSTSC